MTERDLTIRVTKSDILHANLEIAGRLDEESAPLLSGVVLSHLEAGRRFVQVDLSQLLVVSDAAFIALAHAHQLFVEQQGTLMFSAISPDARERVWQLGLDRILLIASGDPAVERQIA